MKIPARSYVRLLAVLKTLAFCVVLLYTVTIFLALMYGSGPAPALSKWQIAGAAWLITLGYLVVRVTQQLTRPYMLEVLPEGVRVRDTRGERSWRWEGIKGVERIGLSKVRIIRNADAGALPWYTYWINYQRWQILDISRFEADAAKALVMVEEKVQAREAGIQSPYPRGLP